MIPKQIINQLESLNLFPKLSERSSIHVCHKSDYEQIDFHKIANWIKENFKNPNETELRNWINFLKEMRQYFNWIGQSMGYFNKESQHSLGHDKWSVGWARDTMLPFAMYAYVLNSYKIKGSYLECGAFKGSSTACLSLIAKKLNKQLLCADSFDGLPSGEGHYSEGDFKGSLEEVRYNVENYGSADNVSYIKGWYNETLRIIQDKLSLLWIDVDLQQSTIDLLNEAFPRIEQNGIIFSDGFTIGVDFSEGDQIKYTGCEAAGLHRYFNDNNIHYKAVPGWSKGLAIIAPNCKAHEKIIFSPEFIETLTLEIL